MKKLLGKRSMFLVALLVGLCLPTMLRAENVFDADGNFDENKVYYIRNVGTGLYLKHGHNYGTYATEGRAAHPFKIQDHGGLYALGSIHGYLASQGDQVLYMDRELQNSKWEMTPTTFSKKVLANDGTVQTINATAYFLRNAYGVELASTGHPNGALGLKPNEDNDNHKWEFVTWEDIKAEMALATEANPVDITSLIKGSDFGRADLIPVSSNGLFSDHIIKELGTLEGNTKEIPSRMALSEIFGNYEEAEHPTWELEHAYINHWVGFKRMESGGNRWTTEIPNTNGIGLSRNNIHNDYTVTQTLKDFNNNYAVLQLPAGKYTFSYQGFYNYENLYSGDRENMPYISITGAQDTRMTHYNDFIEEGGNFDGAEIASYLRDNRENHINTITFELKQAGPVTITITKPRTEAEEGGSFGSRTHWLIALDDFTLVYHGDGNNVLSALYYDWVKKAYLAAAKRVSELSSPASYDNCSLDGCTHWTAWNDAISGLTVNGVPQNGNPNGVNENPDGGRVASLGNNVIDNETDYLAALAKIEAAFQAALKEHESHSNIGSVGLQNPSFELGNLTGWTVTQSDDRLGWVDIRVMSTSGEHPAAGFDGDHMFNAWAYEHGNTNVTGVKQTVNNIENGLYELKAKVTSHGPGQGVVPADGPGNTVYIFGNEFHAGVEAESEYAFKEATLYFLVENGTATIGAIGGHRHSSGGVCKYYYPDGGCFFKADHFRLKRICDVPNGKLKLALDEAKAANDIFVKQGIVSANPVIEMYQAIYDGRTETKDEVDAHISTIHSALVDAAKEQRLRDSDMTYAIGNPNFEWSEANNISNQDDATHKAVGVDGSYFYNTWNTNNATVSPKTYTVDGVPNGTYRLSAMVTSDNGNKVYLTANNVTSSAVSTNDVYGAKAVGGTVAFSASNYTFATTRETSTSDGKIAYSTNGSGPSYDSRLELSGGETLTINATPLASTAETSNERIMILGVDITYRGRSGLFSKTYYYGENLSVTSGKIGDPSNTNADGAGKISMWDINNNTWTLTNGGGRELHITNITVTYRRDYTGITYAAENMMNQASLEFDVTNHTANISIVGGGANGAYNANGGRWFKADDLRLTFLHHTLNAISDAKADNYQVNYSVFEPEKICDGEDWYTDVTIERKMDALLTAPPVADMPAAWHSVVLPYDMPQDQVEALGWEVKNFSGFETHGDVISLKFKATTDGIVAGRPCVMRLTNNDDKDDEKSLANIDIDYVTVKSAMQDQTYSDDTHNVTFTGVYENTKLEKGTFYISNNTFYKVTNNQPTIKPFRAYFVVTDAAGNRIQNVRSMMLRTGEEGNGTEVESTAGEEPTIVGIYNLNGVRTDEIQEGVNIIRMSDGTTIKIIMD